MNRDITPPLVCVSSVAGAEVAPAEKTLLPAVDAGELDDTTKLLGPEDLWEPANV